MQNSSYKKGIDKFKAFVKQNLALIIIIGCVLAITVIVIIAANVGPALPVVDPDPDPDPDPTGNPNDPDAIAKKLFQLPVADYTTVGMDYTNDGDNMYVWNPTLEMAIAHKAVDFLAEDGAEVCAMRAGTVSSVGFTYGYGNYVTVDHGDGIVATYASLADDISVTAGQVLEKGDVIGKVSTSASYEFKDGPHLHLEMKLNGTVVNPWDYLLHDN